MDTLSLISSSSNHKLSHYGRLQSGQLQIGGQESSPNEKDYKILLTLLIDMAGASSGRI